MTGVSPPAAILAILSDRGAPENMLELEVSLSGRNS